MNPPNIWTKLYSSIGGVNQMSIMSIGRMEIVISIQSQTTLCTCRGVMRRVLNQRYFHSLFLPVHSSVRLHLFPQPGLSASRDHFECLK
jgi:hypothetical protein